MGLNETVVPTMEITLKGENVNYPTTLMWIHLPTRIKVYFPTLFESYLLIAIVVIWIAIEAYFKRRLISTQFFAILVLLAAVLCVVLKLY